MIRDRLKKVEPICEKVRRIICFFSNLLESFQYIFYEGLNNNLGLKCTS